MDAQKNNVALAHPYMWGRDVASLVEFGLGRDSVMNRWMDR